MSFLPLYIWATFFMAVAHYVDPTGAASQVSIQIYFFGILFFLIIGILTA